MKPFETAVLADNAVVLAAQLLTIDRQFYTCFPYDNLGHLSSWRPHLSFLNLREDNMNKIIGAFRTAGLGGSRSSQKYTLNGGDEFVNHLRRSVDFLNSVCAAVK